MSNSLPNTLSHLSVTSLAPVPVLIKIVYSKYTFDVNFGGRAGYFIVPDSPPLTRLLPPPTGATGALVFDGSLPSPHESELETMIPDQA